MASNGAAEEPPVKRICSEQDLHYFKSYAGVSIHEDMIRDTVRTNTYRLAILRSHELIAGKVVADIGAGTGILSCFCVQAGAKKVYAVEASAIAEQAKAVIKANQMDDKIHLLRGQVEEVDIPEKVDVIVSEWMGHFLVYESMLNSVIFARDKWLKEDGVILPSQASLYIAPISNEEIYRERIDFWKDMKDKYKLNMECLIPYAKRCIFGSVQIEGIIGSDVIGHEMLLAAIDIKKITLKELQSIEGSFNFRCFGSLPFCGFVTWFTVTFDIPNKESLLMSTSPYKHPTHWRQCVLYVDDPIPVEQDTCINGSIAIAPGKINSRFLDVTLNYIVGDLTNVQRHYTMSDDGPS